MSLYMVMGVSGCGKSSVARLLAEKTGGIYLDTDDFHSPANKQKMAAGIPLDDVDRSDWLDRLNQEMKTREHTPQSTFLACSALRQAYRDRLISGLSNLRFIYLKGSMEAIRARLELRKGHFMPATLLESQFNTLEEPSEALVASIEQPLESLVNDVLRRISPEIPYLPKGTEGKTPLQ
jgi:gluconokinase